MRHNALQGAITSIGVGLSAVEARHRPCCDGKVVDDRDDDNAPGLLAIGASAKFGDNQSLDLVLRLREFFHNFTMTDLGSRTDRRPFRYVGSQKAKLNGRSRPRRRDGCGRRARCPKDAGTDPAADCRSRLPQGPRRTSSLTQCRWFLLLATNRRIARWQPWRNAAQKSPDARRPYRVGPLKKQTPSRPGLHKMRSRDG
jgi:hypothetical protein